MNIFNAHTLIVLYSHTLTITPPFDAWIPSLNKYTCDAVELFTYFHLYDDSALTEPLKLHHNNLLFTKYAGDDGLVFLSALWCRCRDSRLLLFTYFTCLAPDDSVLTEPELTEPGCVCAHVTPGLEARHQSPSTLTHSSWVDISEKKEIWAFFWPNSGEDFQKNLLGAFSRLYLFWGTYSGFSTFGLKFTWI